MNLILFGFKSCGKTTLGIKAAQSISCPFYDTDQLIEVLYQIKTGQHISAREIFKTQGSMVFRELETRVLFAIRHVESSVIAVGGGCILHPINRSFLAQLGKLVYLKIGKETVKKRIFSSDLPGFLDSSNPEKSFEKIFQQRTMQYEQILAYTLSLENQKEDSQIISQLKKWSNISHGK